MCLNSACSDYITFSFYTDQATLSLMRQWCPTCQVQLEEMQGNTFIPFAYIWKEKDGTEKKESDSEKIKSSQKRKYKKRWMGGGNKLLQKGMKEWIGRDKNGKVRRYGDNMSNRWSHAKEWPVFKQPFFPKVEMPKSVQHGPTCPQCVSSGSHALGTGWMLLHPTISSHALVNPGPGCGIFLAGKSHTALGHGCFPLR